MALTALTTQLPGVLPDLFRKPEQTAPRTDDASTGAPHDAGTAAASAQADEQRAHTMRTPDDTTRILARHAALGPLTYGRSMMPAATPAAAPIGLRGAHLDVRG